MLLSRKPLVLAAHPNSFHSCAFLPVSSCVSSHHLQRGRSLYPNPLPFLFPVFSCHEVSCPALTFLVSTKTLFHFHFSSEKKHCKTHQPGVCGVLLLHFTGLVDSTNKIKVMKIQSVEAGLRATSMLCWNWIPFSSSDPAKTIDYFEKYQMLSFF